MNKILMLSVRPDEQAAIDNWQKQHPDIKVSTASWELKAETVAQTAGFDGLVIQQRYNIEPEVYPKLKELGFKQISARTAGFDVLDLKLATQNGLIITNVPAYSPRSVAELALAHTLRLTRNLELFDDRASRQDFRWAGLQAKEIHSLTIGIIGAGRIGGTAAKLFHALGAKVIANDLVENPKLTDILTYMSFEDVLKQADVICLHVDLNETTHHLIDAQALSLMKPTAFLVNECRGPVVDTDALITALEEKRLAGAALDTLTGEENFFNFNLEGQPLPSQQLAKLRSMPNVVITPHIGFYTNIAVQNMVDISLDSALAILKGKDPSTRVN